MNQLVKDLSHEIKWAKTYVKFGISPFGVWRNKSSDPNGSDTRALSSYEAQFADTQMGEEEPKQTILLPQVYTGALISPRWPQQSDRLVDRAREKMCICI
ncbi:family 10 glycosylhydrolase [Paenibacillus larvae]|nr:family 10 glycosylhydrolase [Paenibacillus larvae]MDT2276978.1 family 10 glycosylhydrolase [Paenibacillus larvae]